MGWGRDFFCPCTLPAMLNLLWEASSLQNERLYRSDSDVGHVWGTHQWDVHSVDIDLDVDLGVHRSSTLVILDNTPLDFLWSKRCLLGLWFLALTFHLWMQFQSILSPSGWNEMPPSQAAPWPKALAGKQERKKVINKGKFGVMILCFWTDMPSLKVLHCCWFYVPSGVQAKSSSNINSSKQALVSLQGK